MKSVKDVDGSLKAHIGCLLLFFLFPYGRSRGQNLIQNKLRQMSKIDMFYFVHAVSFVAFSTIMRNGRRFVYL